MWKNGVELPHIAAAANFYRSATALHDIVLRFWEATHLGCVRERLSQVGVMFKIQHH